MLKPHISSDIWGFSLTFLSQNTAKRAVLLLDKTIKKRGAVGCREKIMQKLSNMRKC